MKSVKKVIVFVLLMVFAVSFTSCNETNMAQTSVSKMFEAFKNLDLETARKYVNIDEITKENFNYEITDQEITYMKPFFERLSYNIVSSEKVDKSTVIVKTEITAIDMKQVLSEWLKEYLSITMQNAFAASGKLNDDEMKQKAKDIFLNIITKEDLQMTANTVDITVKKVGKLWMILADDTFTNAITGGFKDGALKLSSAFEEH